MCVCLCLRTYVCVCVFLCVCVCVCHHFPFHSGTVYPGLGAVWVSLQELGESQHGIWQTAGKEEREGEGGRGGGGKERGRVKVAGEGEGRREGGEVKRRSAQD